MNKMTFSILFILFFLPLTIMAQEDITIIENGNSQTVTGSLVTISDSEAYIDTETNLYKVTETNSSLLGDVIKDNAITVADLIGIIDLFMEGESSKIADVNEDDKVTVADAVMGLDIYYGDEPEKSIVESYEVEDITNVWVKSSTAAAVDQH